MAVSSDMPPAETHPQRRHHLFHSDAANAATENMTLDTLLKLLRETGSSKNRNQYTIGCKCSRIEVLCRQLMI